MHEPAADRAIDRPRPPAAGRPAGEPAPDADAHTAARALAGDHAAFRKLHDRYFPRLAGFAAGLLGDPAEAGDVAQDAFLALWAGRTELARQPDGVIPWLFAVTRNRAVSAGRRRTARPARALPADPPVPDPPGPDPDDAAAVADCVGRLGDRAREAIVLQYWEGLSQTEIAAALGLSDATISRSMARALAALRACLERRGTLAPGAT